MLAALAALYPENPFQTAAYAAACRGRDGETWLLGEFDGTALLSGCVATFVRARWGRMLAIPSVAPPVAPEGFWAGVVELCRRENIDRLHVESFGSRASQLPMLSARTSRRVRREFVVDLQAVPLFPRLTGHHKRNIQRARRAGIRVSEARDEGACARHALLVEHSLSRRRERGETITGTSLACVVDGCVEPRACAVTAALYARSGQERARAPRSPGCCVGACLESGIASVYEAKLGQEVVASMVVVESVEGAYCASAGTNAEGRRWGAAHLLNHEIAHALQAAGKRTLNLGGGSPSEAGLLRFKSGFGASATALEAAIYDFRGPLRRWVTEWIRSLHQATLRRRPARRDDPETR